jgi:hypothetical protein
LAFIEDPERRLELVRFGSWFSQGRGVVTVCELRVGDVLELGPDREKRRAEIDALLRREGIPAFGEVDIVPSIAEGIVAVAQANGMAAIESNTVLLGWPGDPKRLAEFLRVIRRLESLRKSLVIGRVQETTGVRDDRPRTVDVWWGGLQRNGDLMLLLAYLLTRNPKWRRARIRVLSVASNELMKAETDRFLGRLLPELRIAAEVRVFVKPADLGVRDLIRAESAAADVVLLGLATPPEGQDEEEYARRLFKLAEGLPTVFLVKNASLFVGELVVGEGRAPGPRVPLPSKGQGV